MCLTNRSEILFLYDVTDSNPNGDPVDENKPRIDEATGVNIVTDVRLKRTIRDYLHAYRNQDIFVREVRNDNGTLRTKEDRLADFKNDPQQVISNCIDIRLFGATTAVKDIAMTLTGPVQFKYGRSLHKVNISYVKGTTIMPSKADNKQGTFTERYILPYSLIAFYGVVNENAASAQNLNLTENDITLMMEGMWRGTKNLISGSKFGQMPRLLLRIIYKEGNFYLGELDKRISLQTEKLEEEIRDIAHIKLDLTQLISSLNNHKDKIEKIQLKADERLMFTQNGQASTLSEALKGFQTEAITF
ncbi:type I-B CRISPR-associated protein Cas7/Csh2 [Caldithrix abyssi]